MAPPGSPWVQKTAGSHQTPGMRHRGCGHQPGLGKGKLRHRGGTGRLWWSCPPPPSSAWAPRVPCTHLGIQSHAGLARGWPCPVGREAPGAITPKTRPKPKALRSHPAQRAGRQPSCPVPILTLRSCQGWAITAPFSPRNWAPPSPWDGARELCQGFVPPPAAGLSVPRARCLPRAVAALPAWERISPSLPKGLWLLLQIKWKWGIWGLQGQAGEGGTRHSCRHPPGCTPTHSPCQRWGN